MPQQPKLPKTSLRSKLPKIPKQFDQGWATIIAALIGAFVALCGYYLQPTNQASPEAGPTSMPASGPVMQGTAAQVMDQWWQVVQHGGIAEYTNENQVYCFKINHGGNQYDAILLGSPVQLQGNRQYRIGFDVQSTIDTSMQIVVTEANTPYKLIAQKVLDLAAGKHSYMYEFATDQATSPDATITFHLGGDDNRQICVEKITIID